MHPGCDFPIRSKEEITRSDLEWGLSRRKELIKISSIGTLLIGVLALLGFFWPIAFWIVIAIAVTICLLLIPPIGGFVGFCALTIGVLGTISTLFAPGLPLEVRVIGEIICLVIATAGWHLTSWSFTR